MNDETMRCEDARKLFDYNPDSGILSWRNDASRHKSGDEVGHNSGGYRKLCIGRRQYSVHRVIWLYMTGQWPNNEIDHINMVKDDNRWANLREATRIDNSQNRSIRSDNVTGYPGVYWDKGRRKWRAEIYYARKKIQIGMFHDLELAIFVREHFDERLKGSFAPAHVFARDNQHEIRTVPNTNRQELAIPS